MSRIDGVWADIKKGAYTDGAEDDAATVLVGFHTVIDPRAGKDRFQA